MLDIKFPFTCGEWNLRPQTLKKFQNITSRIADHKILRK